MFLPWCNDAREDAASLPPPAQARHGSETILLVEDNDLVLRATSAVLRRQGYEVLEASGAGEALLLFEHHAGEIQLLLTDVVMPGLGGPELARKLVALRPKLRVVFMSGHARELAMGDANADESVAFVQKPFTSAELGRKVREVLDAD